MSFNLPWFGAGAIQSFKARKNNLDNPSNLKRNSPKNDKISDKGKIICKSSIGGIRSLVQFKKNTLTILLIWSLIIFNSVATLAIKDQHQFNDSEKGDYLSKIRESTASVLTDSQPRNHQALSARWHVGGNIKRIIGPGAQSNSSHSISKPHNAHNLVFNIQAALIPVLVILSGIFAGLTLGYMSLDSTQLIVLSKSGTQEQKAHAKKIAPLRKDGHLLLITLLVANMIANEALPVVSENVLGGGIQAIVVSTVLVIIFSEIIPQSVCSTHGLKIGAVCAAPVQGLIYLFYPITWPIAKLLTKLLGKHSGVIYRRAELKELVNLHGQEEHHGGDLEGDVVTIVRGALDLQERVVADSMKPLKTCFMLDIETKLDFKALNGILESGHSRIPVYETIQTELGPKKRILGALLTKQLILIDPEDGLPLRDFPLNPLPIVPSDMPLLNILNRFQEGRSHLAIVFAPTKSTPILSTEIHEQNPAEIQLSSSQIVASVSNEDGKSEKFESSRKPNFLKRLFTSRRSKTSSDDEAQNGSENKISQGPSDNEKNGSGQLGGQNEQGVFPKIRHSMNLSKNALTMVSHDFEIDQEPIGIISLEDVLEQLLGEPIYDETDQDGSGQKAVSPYLPPEAIEALKPVETGSRNKTYLEEQASNFLGKSSSSRASRVTNSNLISSSSDLYKELGFNSSPSLQSPKHDSKGFFASTLKLKCNIENVEIKTIKGSDDRDEESNETEEGSTKVSNSESKPISSVELTGIGTTTNSEEIDEEEIKRSRDTIVNKKSEP